MHGQGSKGYLVNASSYFALSAALLTRISGFYNNGICWIPAEMGLQELIPRRIRALLSPRGPRQWHQPKQIEPLPIMSGLKDLGCKAARLSPHSDSSSLLLFSLRIKLIRGSGKIYGVPL
mgnify:CR=1 FL=1